MIAQIISTGIIFLTFSVMFFSMFTRFSNILADSGSPADMPFAGSLGIMSLLLHLITVVTGCVFTICGIFFAVF